MQEKYYEAFILFDVDDRAYLSLIGAEFNVCYVSEDASSYHYLDGPDEISSCRVY